MRSRAGDLFFCLFASFNVESVVLNMCMRRDLEGVDINSGRRISRSLCQTAQEANLVGVMTLFLRKIMSDWTSFSRTSADRLAWCSKSNCES